MSSYLLSCSCGGRLVVETGQAGETLRCDCGRQVVVPALRQLRALPPADDVAAIDTKAAAAWSTRHAVVTVLLLAAFASLAVVGVSWWRQPTLPTFNPAGWTQLMDTKISELTPEAAWQAWVQFYEPLTQNGFSPIEYHGTAAIEQEIGRRRWVQLIFGSLAAVCLIAAAVTSVSGRTAAV
jgi:hypothetical protein